MEDWDFSAKIEEMSPEAVEKRVREAMDYRVSARITTIPYVGGVEETVEHSCPELTAKCPMTGVRDFYLIAVRYVPDKLLPELKSLKLYFSGYDDLPISHEHLAAKIFQDFTSTVGPKKCRLELDTSVRGGIKTIIVVGNKDL